MNEDKIKKGIRNIPDFPKKGIQFKDITPLLMKPKLYSEVIETFSKRYSSMDIDVIVGIESRGFIFAGPLSLKLNCSFALARKKGKLPSQTVQAKYDLEYGTDYLEMHTDSIKSGSNVLIIDDLLATGGTTKAVVDLVEKLNGNLIEIAYLIELADLDGRKKFNNKNIFSLIKY